MKTNDNITLDPQNKEFFTAARYVENTNQCVFLTGKAGTGKTTFLKHIAKTTKKKVVVLAPTGIAALNAGGQTLHSFFRLPFNPLLPIDRAICTPYEIKRFDSAYEMEDEGNVNIYKTFRYSDNHIEMLNRVDTFIIDEVSMVRCDIIDAVDKLLRVFTKRMNVPFGGKQMVFVGDPYQLPPVVKDEDERHLSVCYPSFFFFDALAFQSLRNQGKLATFELNKIYRQTDQKFTHLLNAVRENKTSWADLQLLNTLYKPGFEMPKNEGWIELTARNDEAEYANMQRLQRLPGKEFVYEAKIEGEVSLKQLPCEVNLRLRAGAQVVFLKNDSNGFQRYVNGTIGFVERCDEDEIYVRVGESILEVKLNVWENIRYTWNPKKKETEKEVIGTVEQFPIKLAWAITIHKSQGLTLERVFANLKHCFAPGQVYVALSRCTTFNGLVLKNSLQTDRIKVKGEVVHFTQSFDAIDDLVERLPEKEADFYFESAIQFVLDGDLENSLIAFDQGMALRNEWANPLTKRLMLIYVYRFTKAQISQMDMAVALSVEELLRGAENIYEAINDLVELGMPWQEAAMQQLDELLAMLDSNAPMAEKLIEEKV